MSTFCVQLSLFGKVIYWKSVLFSLKIILILTEKFRCVYRYMSGFLFCSIDLFVCLCNIQFILQQLDNILVIKINMRPLSIYSLSQYCFNDSEVFLIPYGILLFLFKWIDVLRSLMSSQTMLIAIFYNNNPSIHEYRMSYNCLCLLHFFQIICAFLLFIFSFYIILILSSL